MVGFLNRRGLFGGIGPQTLLGLAAGIGSGDTIGEGLGRGFALAGRGLELDRQRAQDTRRRELLSELSSDTSGTFGSLSPQVRALAAESPDFAQSLVLADVKSRLADRNAKPVAKFGALGGDRVFNRFTGEIVGGTADTSPAANLNLTDSQRGKFDLAKAQGASDADAFAFASGRKEFKTDPVTGDLSLVDKLEGTAQRVDTGRTAAAPRFQQDIAKSRIDRAFQSAEQFDSIGPQLDLMEAQLLTGQVQTGGTQELLLPVRKLAADITGRPSEALSNQEVFNAAANFIIPRMRPAGSGATSNFEIDLFKSAAPNLSNSPLGNRVLVQMMQGQRRRAKAFAVGLEKFAIQNGGRTAGFEKQFDKTFPPTFPRFDSPEAAQRALAAGRIQSGTIIIVKRPDKGFGFAEIK